MTAQQEAQIEDILFDFKAGKIDHKQAVDDMKRIIRKCTGCSVAKIPK